MISKWILRWLESNKRVREEGLLSRQLIKDGQQLRSTVPFPSSERKRMEKEEANGDDGQQWCITIVSKGGLDDYLVQVKPSGEPSNPTVSIL
ncbi:hypothetical protein L2E82_44040 [Cichorium intybus]|uniref:Uncharacterized protein n=1 Tax=Cichorium intybus TaxID=13427 RepID=A0ACB8ZQ56_CICIN|nr:hypothetical protein L2E82_44040 [Cichorium intybus]